MDHQADDALATRCAVAIMAKTPEAGRSKTRLCPPLTLAEAAMMSGAFLRDMARVALQAGEAAPIDLFVAYAPAGAESGLAPHLPAGTALLLADGAGVTEPGVAGFGRCLLQAIRKLLDQGYGAVCVLNADSPTLPPAVLVQAASRLCGGATVVMGPASDGGYYLLGMAEDHPGLFADIAWSTGAVAEQTRCRAVAAGVAVDALEPWYDVDDAAGLHRLMSDLDGGAVAPATQAALRRIDLRARLTPLET